MNAMTTMTAACDPFWSKIAEHTVQITKEINMPAPDQMNNVLRLSLSTRNAAEIAEPKLNIWRTPLMSVWVSGLVTPTVSSTRVR
jgi:hypothetical protein